MAFRRCTETGRPPTRFRRQQLPEVLMSGSDAMIDISYPLHWPEGWLRATHREAPKFAKQRTLAQARDLLLGELRKLGVPAGSIVISSNVQCRADGLPRSGQAEPSDSGVAVYFKLSGKPQVLACDKWRRTVDNLYAVALHVNAIRGQERWGVGTVEQAFRGYLALPAPPSDWQILGISPGSAVDAINRAFRERAASAHPDQGGDHHEMARLTAARARLINQAQGGAPHVG